MTMKDGGTAFPVVAQHLVRMTDGITLRRFYKAAALAGLLADNATQPQAWDCVAQICGEAADALIEEDEAHAWKEGR